MSLYYRDKIRESDAYQIAKLLQRKTYSTDHEDVVQILEAAMWMIDDLQDEVAKLKFKLKEKPDATGKVEVKEGL